ncbi:hypothetical protein CQW23_20139 [Capsicum baccatum]|uniref:PWWP domain-containing protein n=1 Tax=Capsicum baccatum TaxID=33114 RepID=A0A2G2W7S2_CAPBA|nr:hypothetical protein CQW23_20139 [Capsicum baccatum]
MQTLRIVVPTLVGIRASAGAGGGANLSEDAESLRGVSVGTAIRNACIHLGKSHIGSEGERSVPYRFEENRSNESVRDAKVRVSATSISNAAVSAADDFEAKRVSMEVEDSRVLNEESKVSETRVKDVKEEGEGGSSAKSGRVKSEQKGKTALVSSKKAEARKGKSEAIVSEYDLMLSKFDDFAGSGKCWSVGYGFEMGDMVWGKVKSHPWWPGHIYNEAFATPSVRRSKREDCILVAFYGDSSYGWFDPDDLVHFEPTFAEKSLQTHVKNFIKAVEEGVDEVGRRSALGLVCHCRKKYRLRAVSVNGFFAVDFSDLERNCTYSASQIKKARERFQPKETLDFVKKLALKPRSKVRQDLDFVKKKATTLAFRKAAFEEDDPTYAEAFGIVPSKQPEEVAQPFRKPSSRGIGTDVMPQRCKRPSIVAHYNSGEDRK